MYDESDADIKNIWKEGKNWKYFIMGVSLDGWPDFQEWIFVLEIRGKITKQGN